MRWAAYAILALPVALTVTGVLPMAAAALLERLLEPLGVFGVAAALAALAALALALVWKETGR